MLIERHAPKFEQKKGLANRMKKEFISPICTVVTMEQEDIITASVIIPDNGSETPGIPFNIGE